MIMSINTYRRAALILLLFIILSSMLLSFLGGYTSNASMSIKYRDLSLSIPTPSPNNRSIAIKHIRHGGHHGTDTRQNRQGIMNTHVLIKRHAHHCHPTSCDIPRNSHEAQRRRSKDTVRVDDVHVTRDKHRNSAESKDTRGHYRGPHRDRVLLLVSLIRVLERKEEATYVVCPSHPEQPDRNQRTTYHGKPKTIFRTSMHSLCVSSSISLRLQKLLLRPAINQRHK